MATPTTMTALTKTKQALEEIKASLEPVIQRLKDNAFNEATGQAQATVSLSIGMMKYMGARLQGTRSRSESRRSPSTRTESDAESSCGHQGKKSSVKETQSQAARQSGAKKNQEQVSRDSTIQTSKSASVEQPPQTGQAGAKDESCSNDAQCASKKRNADGSKRRSKKLKSK